MKVFISWSGERSKAVAALLKEWIPSIMQHVVVWFSEDMERGSVWFNEICKGLSDVSLGIICLTQENLNNPWILFEAGAIAKGIPENRVCTFLVDLGTADIAPPLSQFNATSPNREQLYKLIKTINDASGNSSLSPDRLDVYFGKFWSDFEDGFAKILKNIDATPNRNTSRSQKEMLTDILDVVRRIERNTLSQQELRNFYSHNNFFPLTSNSAIMYDNSGTKVLLPDFAKQYPKFFAKKSLTELINDAAARAVASSKNNDSSPSATPPAADEPCSFEESSTTNETSSENETED